MYGLESNIEKPTMMTAEETQSDNQTNGEICGVDAPLYCLLLAFEFLKQSQS